MKRNEVAWILIIILTIGCVKINASDNLERFLKSFKIDINKYKVVCFIPVDGCAKCINPAIDYSRKADSSFILVLSSNYSKSINNLLESMHIGISKVVIDSNNLSANFHLVPVVAPCFYFLKNGQVIKIVDMSDKMDQTNVFKEVDQYLLN